MMSSVMGAIESLGAQAQMIAEDNLHDCEAADMNCVMS